MLSSNTGFQNDVANPIILIPFVSFVNICCKNEIVSLDGKKRSIFKEDCVLCAQLD